MTTLIEKNNRLLDKLGQLSFVPNGEGYIQTRLCWHKRYSVRTPNDDILDSQSRILDIVFDLRELHRDVVVVHVYNETVGSYTKEERILDSEQIREMQELITSLGCVMEYDQW